MTRRTMAGGCSNMVTTLYTGWDEAMSGHSAALIGHASREDKPYLSIVRLCAEVGHGIGCSAFVAMPANAATPYE